jgi:hypothetical protein
MRFRSYYKLPVPQTAQENCVAHNGSLVPVPGRDIMTQAWYQGGASVWDFTDASNPREIAFFDRGPVNATSLVLGGLWSTYYYNGNIFATELARGIDAFGLTPSDELSEAEIDAAAEVQLDQFNAQLQPRITWDPSFAVVRAEFDQLVRAGGISGKLAAQVDKFLARAERFVRRNQRDAAIEQLEEIAGKLNGSPGQQSLAEAILELADTLR